METAKVDIRKLQVLNDRINQCIDALGQVRISVHGLSHSGPQQFPGQPFGSPYPQAGPVGMGYGQQASTPGNAFGQGWGFGQGQSPFAGISHSSPFPYQPFQQAFPYQPYQQLPPQMAPYAQGWGQPGQNPFAGIMHSSPFPYQAFQQGQPWTSAYGGGWGQQQWQPGPGLSHSSPESSGDVYSRLPLNDPFVASRIGQTFPYLQDPQPPGLF